MSQTPFDPAVATHDASRPDVPNHELLRCIGKGSYGEVWLALDALKRWRAVKVIRRREIDGVDHGYEREWKAITRYEEISRSHPSLVPILTVGRDSAYFYYSMELADDVRTNGRLEAPDTEPGSTEEYLAGYAPRTLRAQLHGGKRLPPGECIAHGIALATALEQLHGGGLIHRDIKPDNIIFVCGQPKLADVGLVADVDATYTFAGTGAYLSPEGVRKQAADIYALGKVLYEMVAGRRVTEYPELPKDFATLDAATQEIIRELNEVIFKATAFEPEKRHASAKELREEFEVLKENGSVLRLRELEEREQQRQAAEGRRKRRNRILVRFAAAGLLVTSPIVVVVYQKQQREAERTIAGARATADARTIAAERARAVEHQTALELREIQILRSTLRFDGWSISNWATLERAALSGFSPGSIKAEAAIVFAGLDAHRNHSFLDTAGTDAAFTLDGRVLTAGDGIRPAAIIDASGNRFELPIRGNGKACWGSDGTPMIFAVETNTLVLRNAELGTVVWQFSSAAVRPGSVLAATPDGQRLAAVSTSGAEARALVWAARDEPPREIRLQSIPLALAFTPDGSLLAVGCADGVTRVYSVPEMKEISVLGTPVRPNPVRCLAFTRDRLVRTSIVNATNWLLAVGDHGTELVIWNVGSALPRTFCRGSHWTLASLAFSPDSSLLASGGRNEPRIWDAYSGEMLLRLGPWFPSEVTTVAFSPDGNRLLMASRASSSGAPRTGIWQVEGDRGIRTLRGLAAVVRKVWFSPDNQHIAALSDQGMLAVWDVPTSRLLYQFEAPTGGMADGAAAAFDTSGKQLAFSTGTRACIYDLDIGRTNASWRFAGGWGSQLRFDPEGRLLLLRCDDVRRPRPHREWRLYELKPGNAPRVIQAQSDPNWPVYNVALPMGTDRFLVWSGGALPGPREVQVRSLVTGELLRTFTTPLTNKAPHVRVDANGRWFVYASDETVDSSLVSLDDYHEKPLGKNPFHTMSPSGKEVLRPGWLIQPLGDEEKGIPMTKEWQPSVDTDAFSPNGRYRAWGSQEGLVFVADLPEVERRIGTFQHENRSAHR